MTSAGSRTYQYNDAGQMTNRNGTVLQWNGDGKPSSIGNVGFVYDGVGNRLKKLSGGQQTRYIGGDYEIEDNGTITKYLAGGKKRGNNFFIHHKDHLGSIQVVTNQFGWQVLRQKHKPFGDQHDVVGWHTESKGWIGEREEETELVYLNARYYDPEIGRFTAPDPFASLGQGLNRYAYGFNSPSNFVDPSGLVPCSPGEGCDEGPTVHFLGIEVPIIHRGWEDSPAARAQDTRQRAREQRCAGEPNLPGCGGPGRETPPPIVEPPILIPKPPVPPPPPCPDCGPSTPLVHAGEGQLRTESVTSLGWHSVMYEGYDIYVGDFLVAANVLGSEAWVDDDGVWHDGPMVAASSPPFGPGALKGGVGLVARGRTVLGHYPAYVEKAAELGARRLSIPAGIWNKMSRAQQWAANRRFLDRAIARGDDIILATRASAARAGSFFARELEYLASKGYRVAKDGMSLIAPGR